MKKLFKLTIALMLVLGGLGAVKTDVNAVTIPADDTDITAMFTDAAFKNYVVNNYGNGSVVTYGQVKSVTAIDLFFEGVTSLDGVEYFTALTSLKAEFNNIVEADLSELTNLKVLSLWGNSTLTSINLNGLVNLETLDLMGASITSLDLSTNTALKNVALMSTALESLDVSACVNLEVLQLSASTGLATLNLGTISNLKELEVVQTSLTTLDLQSATSLQKLKAGTNNFGSLDLSGLSALTYANVQESNISSLVLGDNTALRELYLAKNSLSTLDTSSLDSLVILDVGTNEFATLDVSDVTSLRELWVNDNPLTSLNVEDLSSLITIEGENTEIEEFKVASGHTFAKVNLKNAHIESLEDGVGISATTLLADGQTKEKVIEEDATGYYIETIGNAVPDTATIGDGVWDSATQRVTWPLTTDIDTILALEISYTSNIATTRAANAFSGVYELSYSGPVTTPVTPEKYHTVNFYDCASQIVAQGWAKDNESVTAPNLSYTYESSVYQNVTSNRDAYPTNCSGSFAIPNTATK
ncbi:MAG: leucine-rich repeat domain-containing protein [Anaerorhabdus sp.]